MDRDNFFENLHDDKGVQAQALRVQRQLAYEERCIKRVFTECGIKINGWGRYANRCREATGRDRLNFQWFNQEFQQFPGTLSGKRIPYLHELTLLDLFKPAEKNRLGKAISKGLTDFRATNFVFMFPVTRTMFVAHRHEPSSTDNRIVWSAFAEPTLFVEPSKAFFHAVGREWFEG
jgi:hypothetical protein